MWISRGIWLRVLLWNSFDRGYLNEFENPSYFLKCDVEVTSPHLWVIPISEDRENRFEIIKTMRDDEGKHFYEICDFLNQNGYKPQRTSVFTPQNVFGIYRKMNIRKVRLEGISQPIFSNFSIEIQNNPL